MNLFQMLFVPLCAALCLATLVRGARGQLRILQSLFWGVVWGLAAVLIAWPQAASWAAAMLGIGRGSDLVSYMAVLAGMAACLYFYQRYRRLESLCTELIRADAIRQAVRGAASESSPAAASRS